jgi:hypothetical protein
VTVRGNINPLLMGGDDGYQISRSVRLRGSATAYLNRTPSSASNRDTWTWSGWVKLGTLTSTVNWLFLAGSQSVTDTGFYFYNPNNTLQFLNRVGSTINGYIYTTAVFRDPSAWYHVVAVYDSPNATATDRMQLYLNGVRQTVTVSTQLSSGADSSVNNNVAHFIGAIQAGGTSANNFDGYLTDINFIDGQALTPTSFGAFDAVTGVWNPKAYSGTYGTNGFYLNFKDPTSTTTIGYDYSGNSNNWTSNNVSVTAGSTYDSMVDVPTNYGADTGVGGSVRGNYATFSPLDVSPSSTAQTITQGNLSLFSSSGVRIDGAYSTMAVTSGKWYVELTCTTRTADYPTAGWCSTSFNTNGSGFQYQAGNPNNTKGASLDPGGAININGATTASNYYGTTWAAGNIIQVAVDIDNKLIWFGKAGSWTGTAGNMNGNPATGTNGASFSGQGGTEFKFQCCIGDSDRGDVNFGQSPFTYTAPSGFKALCTQNFTTPTISNGANYMAASLYTGTGASLTVSNAVNSISFQPDLVWVKSRSTTGDNKWTDSVRGVTKALISNTTGAETTDSTGLTAFGSSGFTVGSDTNYNNSGATYVGWQWKASGSTVSNTTGSITSTVNANTTAGFSILIYTGNGTVGATVGHGLGVTPGMVIVKSRSATADWPVKILPYMAGGSRLELSTNNAITTEAAGSGSLWNATNPNSTVITLGNQAMTNTNGTTYVAYCFAQIAGYSAFGSYVGNGSADGVFVYCGFSPRFVMVKKTNAISSWTMLDSSRSPSNVVNKYLYANETSTDGTFTFADFLSNGFKWRTTEGSVNASGDTFIYAVFAENPFTISRAR